MSRSKWSSTFVNPLYLILHKESIIQRRNPSILKITKDTVPRIRNWFGDFISLKEIEKNRSRFLFYFFVPPLSLSLSLSLSFFLSLFLSWIYYFFSRLGSLYHHQGVSCTADGDKVCAWKAKAIGRRREIKSRCSQRVFGNFGRGLVCTPEPCLSAADIIPWKHY